MKNSLGLESKQRKEINDKQKYGLSFLREVLLFIQVRNQGRD